MILAEPDDRGTRDGKPARAELRRISPMLDDREVASIAVSAELVAVAGENDLNSRTRVVNQMIDRLDRPLERRPAVFRHDDQTDLGSRHGRAGAFALVLVFAR